MDYAITAQPHTFVMGVTGAAAVMNVQRITVLGTITAEDMEATTIDNEGADTLDCNEVVRFADGANEVVDLMVSGTGDTRGAAEILLGTGVLTDLR